MTTTTMSPDMYTRRNYIQTAIAGTAIIGGSIVADINQSQSHAAQEDWSITMAGMSTTKPIAYNKYIYVGSGNSELYKVDSESESIVAQKPVDGPISLHGITANNGGVTVTTAEGTIRHFDHQLNNQWEASISGYPSAIRHESGSGYFGFATDDSSDRIFSLNAEGDIQYQVTVGDGYHNGREIGTIPTTTTEYILAKASDRLSII